MTDFVEVHTVGFDGPLCFDRRLVTAIQMRKDGGARIYIDARELTGPCGFIDTNEDYRDVCSAVTAHESDLVSYLKKQKYGDEPWAVKKLKEYYTLYEESLENMREEMFEPKVSLSEALSSYAGTMETYMPAGIGRFQNRTSIKDVISALEDELPELYGYETNDFEVLATMIHPDKWHLTIESADCSDPLEHGPHTFVVDLPPAALFPALLATGIDSIRVEADFGGETEGLDYYNYLFNRGDVPQTVASLNQMAA